MTDDLAPAIAVFEKMLAEAERKAAEARSALNALYQARGLPPRYADNAGTPLALASAAVTVQIKRDTFYGKKQMTAIRELLEMRRASGEGEGPATPREVVNGLKAGGYRFEAKSDDIALIGVRALMRKATMVFHKLPGTNAYGLASWYPNARTAKSGDESDRIRGASAKPTVKKQRGKAPKARARPRRSAVAPVNPHLTFVENALADGSEWTTDRLMQEAAVRGISGITKQMLHGKLLTLHRRKQVVPLGDGVWKIAAPSAAAPDDRVVLPVKGVA
jgi:hypothetical protein